jgi:hypothetical protein
LIHGHSAVADVTTDNRVQPVALFGDGFVHPSLKLGFQLVQFRLQAFTPELSSSRSPFSTSGITTVATEQPPPTGLSPLGTSTSITAPNSRSYDFGVHYSSPV